MTKQLHLDGIALPPKQVRAPCPAHLTDFEIDARPWPMPAVQAWEPKPRELTLGEKWRFTAQRKVAA